MTRQDTFLSTEKLFNENIFTKMDITAVQDSAEFVSSLYRTALSGTLKDGLTRYIYVGSS